MSLAPLASRAAASALAAALVVPVAGLGQSGLTTAVSTTPDGRHGEDSSGRPRISADGRWVVFESDAQDLVVPDKNGGWNDVFLHDRVSGTTELVNLRPDGAQGPNQFSYHPDISADGRWIVFESNDPKLVSGVAYTGFQVFLRDRVSATTSVVSLNWVGSTNSAGCGDPSISSDGTRVAFTSQAGLLPGIPTYGTGLRVYVRDLLAGVTLLATPGLNGITINASCWDPMLSGDGRYVAYHSEASDLVPFDTNGVADVFVTDLSTGAITRVSVAPSLAQGNGASHIPFLSDDGRFVLFSSAASNLVPGDTNGVTDVFLRDLASATTTRLSLTSSGAQAGSGCFASALSPDGAAALFGTSAALIPGDVNNASDVYVREIATGALRIHSLASDGSQHGGTAFGFHGDLAPGGRVSTFIAQATDLVPCNGCSASLWQVYVRDESGAALPGRYCVAKTSSAGCAPKLAWSGSPTVGGADDFHVLASEVLSQQFGILVWSPSGQAVPFAGGELCVASPRRTPGQLSGGNLPSDCSGAYDFHVSHAFLAANGLAAGDLVYTQFWQRDPGFGAPDNVGLTGGLHFLILP